MRISNKLQLGLIDCGRSARVTLCNVYPQKQRLEDKTVYMNVEKYVLDYKDLSKEKKHCFKIPVSSGWQYVLNRKNRLPQFDENGELIKNPESTRIAVRRATVKVVDMATINDFDYFGTITINEKWHDINNPVEILDDLLKFFNNYKTRSASQFQYLVVPELGEKTGRLHFHFLASGIYSEDLFRNKHRHLDWHSVRDRFGHVQITRIKDTRQDRVNVACYCSKYMTKDNLQIRSHRYFCSKGLKRPSAISTCSPALVVMVHDWLEMYGLEAYSSNRQGKAYSLPYRVYQDLLKYIEECKQKLAEKPWSLEEIDPWTFCPFDTWEQVTIC